MASLAHLVGAYLAIAILIAWFASVRGRSAPAWLIIAVLITPVLAGLLLWFLADLVHEEQRTREFLRAAKQRQWRDPHDTFRRARERQEQDIRNKVITTRRERKRGIEAVTVPPRRLRALENRTPATVIMQM